MQFNLPNTLDMLMLADNFNWDEVFGPDGQDLVKCLNTYVYEHHHHFFVKELNGDWFTCFGASLQLMLRWADVCQVKEQVGRQLDYMFKVIDEPEQVPEQAQFHIGVGMWCWYFHSLGLTHSRDKLVSFMVAAKLTYRNADATVDGGSIPWLRKRGDETRGVYLLDATFVAWTCKLGWVLMATKPEVRAEEVLADLPDVDEIVAAAMTYDACAPAHAMTNNVRDHPLSPTPFLSPSHRLGVWPTVTTTTGRVAQPRLASTMHG
jgi:hypothetical protein